MCSSRWQKEFNLSKCQDVKVTTSRKVTNSSYQLHGQVFGMVTSVKYLGVNIYLSSGLSWNSRIERITAKGNDTLSFTKKT